MSGVATQIQGGVTCHQPVTTNHGDRLFICRFWQVHTSSRKWRAVIRFTMEPQGSFTNKHNQQEKNMNGKSYDRITERIVSLLSQGTVPWHKPWQVKTGLPRNLVSLKPYRGINVFLLMAMNYESPHWLTLRQANLLGGQIKPGEKSCPVVFWKPMQVKDRESGEERKIPFLRLYHVFNVTQCAGLKNIPKADDSASVQTMPAEIVANMPQRPVIKHGMNAAYYSPGNDIIGMPERERFDAEDNYHATLFHELVKERGHEKRLKRASIMERNGYGSDIPTARRN